MRGPRLDYPGAVYHLITRGNNRATVFQSPEEYREFRRRLEGVVRDYDWMLYAYALMPNHVHLLVELTRPTLSAGMQRLLSGYANWRQRRTGGTGHVFQGRFRAILCEKESYMLELVRYIHMNPVRKGLVTHPSEWPWSSHRVYMGLASEDWVTAEPVLERFGPGDLKERRRRFEEFICARVPARMTRALARTPRGGILGSEEFIEAVKGAARMRARRVNRSVADRPTLEVLAASCAAAAGTPVAEMVGRSKAARCVAPRRAFIWLATRRFGYRISDISRFLCRAESVISRTLALADADTDGSWRDLERAVAGPGVGMANGKL